MVTTEPHIDPYLFERQLVAFKVFVEEHSGVEFVSFASNPYTNKQEGYKYKIFRTARDALALEAWNESDIGTGDIAEATISAIEVPNSNLVPWQGRFGAEARPHQPLFEAFSDKNKLQKIECCLFHLYRGENNDASFNELIEFFGKTYPLIAYLFFLKDRTRFLPIAPTFFDRAFGHLGVNFKTRRRCSWDNYSTYLSLLRQVKGMLSEELSAEVSLLDAHSFVWMLAAQMEIEQKLADVDEYLSMSPTERETVVKARIGQGRFRESLIEYWSSCAVTGCSELTLLRASHIKPWVKSSSEERLSLYNGLLLSPAIDTCFDAGYISFDDNGNILISELLTEVNVRALGLSSTMSLSQIEKEHKSYLAFHRENIFK